MQADANGYVAVAPRTYHWMVRNDAQVVLASGEVVVEACATATAPPTATPPGGGVLPIEGSSPTPTGAVEAAVGVGAVPTAPPTDTAAAVADDSPSPMAAVVLFGLASAIAWVTLAARDRSRSRARDLR
jgi:hypothetical protein